MTTYYNPPLPAVRITNTGLFVWESDPAQRCDEPSPDWPSLHCDKGRGHIGIHAAWDAAGAALLGYWGAGASPGASQWLDGLTGGVALSSTTPANRSTAAVVVGAQPVPPAPPPYTVASPPRGALLGRGRIQSSLVFNVASPPRPAANLPDGVKREPDRAARCGEASPVGERLRCTRRKAHATIHVAHGVAGEALAWWEDGGGALSATWAVKWVDGFTFAEVPPGAELPTNAEPPEAEEQTEWDLLPDATPADFDALREGRLLTWQQVVGGKP